jgi:hypothetical protein
LYEKDDQEMPVIKIDRELPVPKTDRGFSSKNFIHEIIKVKDFLQSMFFYFKIFLF